jgi:hypothetical protein
MHGLQLLLALRFYPLFLSLLLLALCCSCTELQLTAFPSPGEHTQAFAEQMFINGDFEHAILEYEQIYETALSPEDRNHALYGLACTQLMLARTEDQLVEAIGNLQKWDAKKGTAPFVENRHLLLLSLKQQSALLEKANKERHKRENEQKEKNKELLQREGRLNFLVTDQKQKLSTMVSTVEKLQNQIKELEAIDMNVQEKRKPL